MASAGTLYIDVLPRTEGFATQLQSQATAAGNAMSAGLTRGLSDTATRSLSTRLTSIGNRMTTVGRSATRYLTLPIVGAGIAAGKMALDFEGAFTQVSALSNASRGDIAKWKDQVLQLSGQTAQSPTDLANALYFLASAGLKTNQVMPALQASAKAAATGLGSTADVANVTASALNAYASSGLTATDVTNTLVAAVKAGRADPNEFATAMGRILPIASKAGVSFDQVAGSLAGLSNIGLDVNEGVTAMRGVLQALVAPSSTAAKAMKDVGLSADQMRSAIADKGLLGAMQLLDKATGGNIDKLRTIIPNIRALTGQFGLTGDNAKQVADVFDQVANSTGDANKAFEETTKGPAFQMQQSLNNIRIAAIQLGEKLIPIGQKIVDTIAGWADAFSNLSPGMQDLILKGAAIAALAGPFLRVGGALFKIAGFLTGIGRSTSIAASAGAMTEGASALGVAAGELTDAAAAISAAAEQLAGAGATTGGEIEAGATAAAGELEAAGATVAAEEEAGAAGGGLLAGGEGLLAGGGGGGLLAGLGGDLAGLVSGGGAVTGGSILALLGLASMPETPGGPSGLFSWKDENAGVAQFTAALNRSDPAATAFVQKMQQARAAVDAATSSTKPLTAQQQQLVKWWGANADQINVANRALAGIGATAHGYTSGVSNLTDNILTNTTAQEKWGGWLGQTNTITAHQAVSLAELTNAYYDAGGALNHVQSNAFETAIAEGHAAQAQHVLNQAIAQMPKSAQTKITADTKGAQADVKHLGEDIHGVPDGRTTVTVDDKQAVGAVLGIGGKIRAIPDGHASVTVDTGQAQGAIGSVLGLLHSVDGYVAHAIVSVSRQVTTAAQGIAAGGVLAGASGFVTRGPTYLVGEGRSWTPWGTGAEGVMPFDAHGRDILADVFRRTLHEHGGGSRSGGGRMAISGKLEIVNGEAYIRGVARSELEDDHRFQASLGRR